jgi:hypothetical protein
MRILGSEPARQAGRRAGVAHRWRGALAPAQRPAGGADQHGVELDPLQLGGAAVRRRRRHAHVPVPRHDSSAGRGGAGRAGWRRTPRINRSAGRAAE